MYSYLCFGILITAATLVATAISTPSNTEVDRVIADAQQSGFVLIGTLGDKVYFMNRTKSNWMACKDRCGSQGLKFGTLSSTEEFRFVGANIDRSDDLWIAASMRGMPTYESHLAFEYEDGTDVPSGINTYASPFSVNLCLHLSVSSDLNLMESCQLGSYGVLCQLVLG